MLNIELKGLKEAIKKIEDIHKRHIPFALSKAINDTARLVKEREIATMQTVFDRPTPFTLRALYIWPATKTRPEAEVYFKETTQKGTQKAIDYLGPQVFGGDRKMKRSERRLNRYYTPGAGVRLNAYGNISPGQITQILSVLKALPDSSQNITARSRRKNRKPRSYFAIRSKAGHLHPGVYERMGSKGRKIRPVLIFVDDPKYRPRYPFFEVGKMVVDQNLPRLFQRALDDAIATGR